VKRSTRRRFFTFGHEQRDHHDYSSYPALPMLVSCRRFHTFEDQVLDPCNKIHSEEVPYDLFRSYTNLQRNNQASCGSISQAGARCHPYCEGYDRRCSVLCLARPSQCLNDLAVSGHSPFLGRMRSKLLPNVLVPFQLVSGMDLESIGTAIRNTTRDEETESDAVNDFTSAPSRADVES
jgi:hypothetical protein